MSELEEINEMLRRHRCEAAVRVCSCAGVPRVLPEENAAVLAEVQGVSVLLPGRVALLKGKVHELPLDVAGF